ncbi:serine hydrolase domain-containing protein [soil metagenome]
MKTIEREARRDGVDYPIRGWCDERFVKVVDAFAANFSEDEDTGACCAVWHRGEPVADLWGGFADVAGNRPWQEDTIVNMMSCGKGLAAFCLHQLVDQRRVDLDAPVFTYWPEFAQNGKEGVLVRHVLDHRAGLPVLTAPLPPTAIFDWKAIISALEQQALLFPAGGTPAYHIRTLGFLIGEIVLRVSGQSIDKYLQEHVCKPLGMDFYISTPQSAYPRIAEFVPSRKNTVLDTATLDPDSLLAKAAAQQPKDLDYNSDIWRSSVIPSSNGHGNARAIAKFYALVAGGGELDGVRLISTGAIDRALQEQHNEVEVIMKRQYHQALGFILNSPPVVPMGPNPRAFGHHGAGGSIGMGDRENAMAIAYAPARMHSRMDNGPRARRVIDAAFASL